MNESLFLILGAISTFANRAAEAVKAFLKAHYPDLPAETISEIALGVSLAAGIGGALALNVNLLTLIPDNPYLAQVSPLFGVLLTGCLASLGSEALHFILDLLQAGRDKLEPLPNSTSSKLVLEEKTSGDGDGDADTKQMPSMPHNPPLN